MKLLKEVTVVVVTLFAGIISMNTFATPIVLEENSYVSIERFPDLDTTAVADPSGLSIGDTVSSIAYGDGSINLSDANGPGLIVGDPDDPDWWHGLGVIYTTTTNTINITFTNLQVTAFTFALGINQSASGWIRAYYETDNGSETSLKTSPTFGINNNASDTFGVRAKNSSASCTLITRIEIEPPLEWGIGDLGITTGGCSDVPEPSTLALLGLGLFGLGFRRFIGNKAALQG
ncbi:MAG: hypothetical protein ACI9XC_000906 [Gammaproteobacteria bacterium]|jgi:hypothetical protein